MFVGQVINSPHLAVHMFLAPGINGTREGQADTDMNLRGQPLQFRSNKLGYELSGSATDSVFVYQKRKTFSKS